MRLRLITAPAAEPLTVAEARAQVSETDTVHDSALTAWITTAREALDGPSGALGRALVTQEWELLLDGFPGGDSIDLPLPPLQSVTSVTYVDSDGATQTLATSVYGVDTASEPGAVHLKYGQSWPQTRAQRNAVVIRFTAGYGGAADVPSRLKSAMKLHVADLFANREAQGEPLAANPAYDALTFPFKVFR